MRDALLVLDEIEARGDPAAAAWLLPLLRDTTRSAELRSAVAATLVTLGFEEGELFCLAVLQANLLDTAPSDAQFGLPVQEHWELARELAYEVLAERLREHGVVPERYEVQFGAPDLQRATAKLRNQLAGLPPLRPELGRTPMAGRLPESAPAGWPREHSAAWTSVREELLGLQTPSRSSRASQ